MVEATEYRPRGFDTRDDSTLLAVLLKDRGRGGVGKVLVVVESLLSIRTIVDIVGLSFVLSCAHNKPI